MTFICTGAVRYIVKSMYDVIHEDGFASIEQKNIEDVTMSRQEIKEEGGHQVIVEELKELYKIA